MSANLPSASQQDPSQLDDHEETSAAGSQGDDSRVQIYLNICDKKASLLDIGEIKKNSGADVQFSPHPSPLQGRKIAIVCGTPSQIEAGVNIISQTTNPQIITSANAQLHWLHWVEDAFPNLDSQSYFLPPVYFNRVPMTTQAAGSQDVLILQSAPGQAGQSNQTPSKAAAANAPASLPGSLLCQSPGQTEHVKETGWRKAIEIISGIHRPVEIVITADGQILSLPPDVVHRRKIRQKEVIDQVSHHMEKLYKKYGDHLDETPLIHMMHLVAGFYNFALNKWLLVDSLPFAITQYWTNWHNNQETEDANSKQPNLSATSTEASGPHSSSTVNTDDSDAAAKRKLEVRKRIIEAGWLFRRGNPREILVHLARNVHFSSVGETLFQQVFFHHQKAMEDAGLIVNLRNYFLYASVSLGCHT